VLTGLVSLATGVRERVGTVTSAAPFKGVFDVGAVTGAGDAITGGTLIGTGATFTGDGFMTGKAFFATGTVGTLTLGGAIVVVGGLTGGSLTGVVTLGTGTLEVGREVEGPRFSASVEVGSTSAARIGADTAMRAMTERRYMSNP
jgi:hypothetical protein